jgi:hypothetical protein
MRPYRDTGETPVPRVEGRMIGARFLRPPACGVPLALRSQFLDLEIQDLEFASSLEFRQRPLFVF